MTAKALIFGACLVFTAATAANAAVRIEALDPPLPAAFPPGWGAFDTTSSEAMQPAGLAFDQTLFAGYRELSVARRAANDMRDGELFNHKAAAAARRSSVLPEAPSDRELSDEDRAAFQAALNRMRAFFERGARETAPETAATAQVKYDCWIEAAEWGRSDEANACKSAYQEAMNELSVMADYALSEVEFQSRKAPMMAAVPLQPEGYLVYFEWDSTVMTPAGLAGLNEAIRAGLAHPDTEINLVGHADTSGLAPYNQTLSEQRALVVLEAMTAAGIAYDRFMWKGVGQTMLLVPTPDGVREQGNRVVEVDIM